jgi:alcohol dehydrogenase
MGGIGWVLGHLINGTQAEYVRTPFADTSLYRVPASLTNEQAAMVSDIYPTGFEIGVQYGDIRPGDVVAVIGAGPGGLAAVATAKFYGPSKVIALDLGRSRLDHAVSMGADVGVMTSDDDWVDQVLAQTDGLGVDVAIEAVGIPDTLQACFRIVRPGGHVANVGVHGVPVELPLDTMWINNLRMTTGLVNATSSEMLISLMEGGRLRPEQMVTHRFTFANITDAYDTFSRALDHDALKVAIHRGE